jgi:hypothetical protein
MREASLYFDPHELFVRDREFADSLLEGDGFELLVPLTQKRVAPSLASASIWAFVFSSCSA